MPEHVRPYSQNDLRAARDAFRLLFRNADLGDRPLRSPGVGLLLGPIRYGLNEDQYRALASAAMAEGDTECYLSYLCGYEDDDREDVSADFELAPHYRFDLRLFPSLALGSVVWDGRARDLLPAWRMGGLGLARPFWNRGRIRSLSIKAPRCPRACEFAGRRPRRVEGCARSTSGPDGLGTHVVGKRLWQRTGGANPSAV